DMHGNVWEWCLDQWHGNYEGAPEDGSAWLADGDGKAEQRGIEGREEERGTDGKERAGGGGRRLLRGGSWDLLPGSCRSAFRLHVRPVVADFTIGFRVVCLRQGPSLNA
ncbi:MAG: formylglycine-generating enzyme family protein, partial [Cyanobacteriota bacterium]